MATITWVNDRQVYYRVTTNKGKAVSFVGTISIEDDLEFRDNYSANKEGNNKPYIDDNIAVYTVYGGYTASLKGVLVTSNGYSITLPGISSYHYVR